MKITIKDQQYTVISYSSETIGYRFFLFPIQGTVVYCYDKTFKPFRFLASEIVKYG